MDFVCQTKSKHSDSKALTTKTNQGTKSLIKSDL